MKRIMAGDGGSRRRVQRGRSTTASVAVLFLVVLAGACEPGPRPDLATSASPQSTSSEGPGRGNARRGVLHIPDVAGDILDHKGRHVGGHPEVDLVDIAVKADDTTFTVAFTCRGKVPASSGPGRFEHGKDRLYWGIAFWFTEDPDDMRRYGGLRAQLVDTKWGAEVTILGGSKPGAFALEPKASGNILEGRLSLGRTRIVITVPRTTLPKMPAHVFVSGGTQWDYYSPGDTFGYSAGGDRAPDGEARVSFRF